MSLTTCYFCKTSLIEDARFCHNCGAKVTVQVNNRGDDPETPEYEPTYPLNFEKSAALGSQIRQFFVQELDRRIHETQNTKMKNAYMNRLMQTDFHEVFELRTNQLAEAVFNFWKEDEETAAAQSDQLLGKSFDGLLDYFLVKYCADINETNIPEAALKYENMSPDQIDWQQMVVDYLQPADAKDLTIYTDFIKMPLRKLQNASRSFLFPDKNEKILLIADQTVFGTCREGFALTEFALYWKAHFKEPVKLFYSEIESIRKEKDWLLINDHFFNANPSLNGRMVYLLRKLSKLRKEVEV